MVMVMYVCMFSWYLHNFVKIYTLGNVEFVKIDIHDNGRK